MTDPLDTAAIRANQAAYRKSHDHPGAFACCSAHASADDVPALLARIAELEADATRKRPLLMCNGGEMVLVTDMKAYLARPTTLPAGWYGQVAPISDTTGGQQW